MNPEELKEFYKKYPDIFLEEFFGLKLFWYQKVLIRTLIKTKSIFNIK